MNTLDYINVKSADADKIVKALKDLLANYQVFYTNVRGFHWDIQGHHFGPLHKNFEELYTELAERIDEVAERILVLGGSPDSGFSTYLKVAKVKEVKCGSCAWTAIQLILDDFKMIIQKERAAIELASGFSDEGTADLLTGFLREHEKRVWMYCAYLNQGNCEVKKAKK